MEEQMWKQFYEKLQEKENKTEEDKTEHEIRIQELDGGFFERFGSLLKEQSTADVAEPPQDEVEDEVVEEEIKKDSSNQLLAEAVGLNIEELYSEVLYEVIHTVGCMAEAGEQEVLFQYLQKAFRLDPEKHDLLLQQAQSKEPPNILLNVQIVEAKELRPKDANGLSDPFCTLYLSSAPTHRYNTSVKEQTLSPLWEEHFSLPVESPGNDVLCLEVWDFDPAETVREKMTKITDVKGVKGLRKLMKEIAVTASTGKHDNELIGSALIQLKNIPATGQIMWVNLEKKTKVRRQGIVRVKVAFSSEKNTQVATQEHRHLLRIFALHEIESVQAQEGGEWNGEFSSPAESVLQQHVAQSSMTVADEALAQWAEYAAINQTHPISCQTFYAILQKLIRPLSNGLLTDDEIKSFWDGAKKILPSCFNIIKKLRKLPSAEESTTTLLKNTLCMLLTLASVQPPQGTDLFPASVYGWLTSANCTIPSAIQDAVTQAAIDWFIHITDHNKPEDSSEKAQLKQQIKIIQLVRADLQKAIEFHDKLFTLVQVPYAKTLYTIYECKVSEMTEPLVNDICASLKPLRNRERSKGNNVVEDDPLALGTSLFEMYLALQRFAILGTAICPTDADRFHITQFHSWFHRAVAHWLDIAVYKAMLRIERAVELDELIPIDSTVKYSSSAVDTLHIYYQIKTFWQQLSWPDVEGSYTFVAKIMDDICRCSVYYADIMALKVDKMGHTETVYEKKFEVTNEWCLAINNIDYVRQSIQPFVKELGMDDIIMRLADFKSPSAAEHCRETLQLVMDNAVETVKNKILDLLETVAEKMSPAVRRFLMEGAELVNQENNSVDRLMQYLDENLTTLSSQLNPDNFDRTLTITFDKLSRIMYELVENGLEKRRPPSFFANLHKTLTVLMGFFRQGDNNSSCPNKEMLTQIERLLTLHGMETTDLIMQVHVSRLEEQRQLVSATNGLLTIRLQFVHDTLRIEIMNARNLKPMDSNGSCDPYVKIHLLPEEVFGDVTRPRTKTQKRNLFPLFDETFSIQLTREQRLTKDAMLLFMVKDQDYFGMSSQFLGEAYYSFLNIPATTMETNLQEMQQIHLKLSKPTNFDCDAMKALDHRQGEKLARDFIKRQRSKHNPVPS